MQLRLPIFLVLLLLGSSLFGQMIDAVLHHQIGSTGNHTVIESARTNSTGHLYTAGHFTETVDFDPGIGTQIITSSGETDPFLSKFDANGNFLWVKTLDGSSFAGYRNLHISSNGDVFAIALFQDTIDIDPGPATEYYYAQGPYTTDALITRYSSNGTLIWGKHLKNINTTQASCYIENSAIDDSDNIYVVGRIIGSYDMDPGPGQVLVESTGIHSSFLAKYDENGDYLWHFLFYSPDMTTAGKVITSGDGHIYFTGGFRDSLNLDTGQTTITIPEYNSTGTDTYLGKASEDGEVIWLKHLGGVYSQPCQSIAIDADGHPVFVGNFTGTTDFDPDTSVYSLTPQGYPDAYILNLNPEGEFQWVKTISGTGSTGYNGIRIHPDSTLYLHGNFTGTADFNPGPGVNALSESSTSFSSMFITQLTHNGEFIWAAKFIKGAGYQEISDFSFNHQDKLLLGGSFNDSISVHPSLTNSVYYGDGIYDGMVFELETCYSSSYLNDTVCDSLISPSGNHTWTSTGIHSDTFVSVNGCDSVVYIDLVVHQSTVTNLQIIECDSFQSPSGDTTWYNSGTYIDSLTSTKGCDSIFYVDLFIPAKDTTWLDTASCPGFYWDANDQTYALPTSDTIVLTNSYGCDSVCILELSFYTDTFTIDTTSCPPFYWEPINLTINNPGQFIHHSTNGEGCDSITILNLSFWSDSTTIDTATCTPFYWSVTDSIYTQSTQEIYHSSNVKGCDSTTVLNLQVTIIDTTVQNQGYSISSQSSTADYYQWFECFEDSLIILPADTLQSFVPSLNGYYAVEVTENGCIDTSGCHELTAVHVYEPDQNGWRLYPNPFANVITLETENSTKGLHSLKLFNSLGQMMFEQTIDASNRKVSVHTAHLPPGAYHLVVQFGDGKQQAFSLVKVAD